MPVLRSVSVLWAMLRSHHEGLPDAPADELGCEGAKIVSAVPRPEPDLAITKLAQVWADAAGQTTYLAMSGAETEQFLAQLITKLVTAMTVTPVDERAVMEVAAELVAHDLTGSRSIGCSIEVLTDGLPQLPQLRDFDRLDAAVLRVVIALSAGYAQALRRRTLGEPGASRAGAVARQAGG
jgi:hypothetical protein